MNVESTLSSLYRAESPKILASLIRIFGNHNIDLAEDMMHEAFNTALLRWQNDGLPDNPKAWLIQTAKNRAIDLIRSQKNKIKLSEQLSDFLESEWTMSHSVEESFHEPFIRDEQLRLIFLSCTTDIKPQNQIPFILKALCGFNNRAVASALLLPEETVKKRLLRTKQQLKELPDQLPDEADYQQVIERVHTVVYLLFNEGFHSTDHKSAIRKELCIDAIALLKLVIEHPTLPNKETLSLFALMHFHLARIDTRLDEQDSLIPLNLQNRRLWNQHYIAAGCQMLAVAKAYRDPRKGRFFLEASIAEKHCVSAHFEDTCWSDIVELYKELVEQTDSDVARLNLAVALGYAGFSEQAIGVVGNLGKSPVLSKTHMLDATLAHLYAMAGDKDKALAYAKSSGEKGGTPHEQQLMRQQLDHLLKVEPKNTSQK
ncbi:RNA polymerase sigma factor [Vibrio nigripulchritudo]|uniref:RNA polymerase sigma factor n=1 Tax=Vibrio nigripulchritudo TaxID=28173 RepID=UPI00248FBC1F|nr:sigma-70 family RNA polymerase sigma factor [Vibrio nigripulchritudo]BDU39973.1 RNA polymerase subunit sigma-24 [Vibrio nigripulchritudo]BDU45697.1 RNA polymerase subunit sigma-24 [Vibrio nigripulchritudo]